MIAISRWGKDHWSTFAYLETLAVDHEGIAKPDNRRMRTNEKTHPHLLGSPEQGASQYATRLKDGEAKGHDDWDCLDDAVEVGFLEDIGTGINRVFKFTKLGQKVASQLRVHKMNGGNFGDFISEAQKEV